MPIPQGGPINYPATLSARQRHLYLHLCDVFAPVPQYDQNDTDTGTRWELREQSVRCFFAIHLNADEVHPFGRIAFDSLLTLDQVLFGRDQDVDSDYILVNRTLNDDGTPGDNYGFFWRVRGPAQVFTDAGRRHAGRKLVLAYREKTPPDGVSVT